MNMNRDVQTDAYTHRCVCFPHNPLARAIHVHCMQCLNSGGDKRLHACWTLRFDALEPFSDPPSRFPPLVRVGKSRICIHH
jgi:hypothetical protein